MKTRTLLFLLVLFALPTLLMAEKRSVKISHQRVLQVNLQNQINSYTWVLMQKSLKKATDERFDLVLIHMNTYGGEVLYADSIRSAILDATIPVYVFINNNAASAGALISIACDSIYMRSGATIGASTVVDQSGTPASDKVQSYMKGIIRATAEAKGKVRGGVDTDSITAWRRDPRIAEAMVAPNDSGHVLTLTAYEALKNGYCEGIAENVDAVLGEKVGLSNYEVVVYKMAGVDKLKGRLMGTALRAILIMIIVAGIWFELQAPGIGFPTLAAVGAAVLYFAPLYLEGLAQNWEIAAFIVGALLLLVELFVIPGFGIAGVLGILSMVLGMVFALVGVDFTFSMTGMSQLTEPLLLVSLSIVVAVLLMIWITSKIGNGKGLFHLIALSSTQEVESGFIGIPQEITGLVGLMGITSTILKPSGKVTINGKNYDAVAVVGYLEPSTPVVVVRHEAGQVYVKASTAD